MSRLKRLVRANLHRPEPGDWIALHDRGFRSLVSGQGREVVAVLNDHIPPHPPTETREDFLREVAPLFEQTYARLSLLAAAPDLAAALALLVDFYGPLNALHTPDHPLHVAQAALDRSGWLAWPEPVQS